MSAADTLFEVFQLSDHVPVTHALEPRGVRRLHAPPVRTVAGSAGRIAPQPFARSPLRRGRGGIVRQRLDVNDDVIYCGAVAQRPPHPWHHAPENIPFLCTPGTSL